jgi:hypothetical protein
VSTEVESIASHSPEGSQPAGAMKAVPRRSRMSEILSPFAKRCATSTMARSALPKSSRSALESGSTERRTLSDQ